MLKCIPFIKVVRYTALLSGVFYGIAHRRSLQKTHDEEKRHHAIHEREQLIAQAKDAWKRKQEGAKDGGAFVIIGTSQTHIIESIGSFR